MADLSTYIERARKHGACEMDLAVVANCGSIEEARQFAGPSLGESIRLQAGHARAERKKQHITMRLNAAIGEDRASCISKKGLVASARLG